MSELDKILLDSDKAELLEDLSKKLPTASKVIIVLIEDEDDGTYDSQVMILGLDHTYEAYGILEVAKQDLMENDY